MSTNAEAFKALEIKMAAAEVQITTDLKVVNTRLEKLLASEPESKEDLQIITQKRGVEEQQKTTLMQCVSLCQAAADGQLKQQVIPSGIIKSLAKQEQYTVISEKCRPVVQFIPTTATAQAIRQE
jgi:hypothetical protein